MASYGPSYGPPQQPTNWMKTGFNVLVALVLIIVILVLLTKYQWVHCSQVPGNWCEVYCKYIVQKHSRVAILFDPLAEGESVGNATKLRLMLAKERYFTVIQPYPISQMSGGLLKDYDLVILEQAPRLTFKQADALLDYLNAGGTLVWVGDAASQLYVSEEDLSIALARNQTEPGYYESVLAMAGRELGFGFFGDEALFAKFVGNVNVTGPVEFSVVQINHPITRGLKYDFETLPFPRFTQVSENPSGVEKPAVLKYGGKEYPAIIESRYAGKVVYFAYPIESTNSTSLMNNLLAYLLPC